jgi:hypothetical protein
VSVPDIHPSLVSLGVAERWFEGHRLVAGDLLELEGWYVIDEFEVCSTSL